MTGGSGFLGGSILPTLVARGHEVTALVRTNASGERVRSLGATPISGDLEDAASIDEAFALSEAEALVNLASLGFGHAPTIVAAAEEAGLNRAVFVSTTSIFTRLATASKPVRVTAEEAIQASSLDWTIVRPTMIYGRPGDRNMARLLRALHRFPILPLPGGGTGLQQPVHIDDLAAAIVNALDRPASVHRAYNLAGPEPMTLRTVIEEAAGAVGRRPRLVSVPLKLTMGLVWLYEKAAPTPRMKAEQLARLAENKAVDIGPAEADLDFAPRAFVDGIRAEAALLQ